MRETDRELTKQTCAAKSLVTREKRQFERKLLQKEEKKEKI